MKNINNRDIILVGIVVRVEDSIYSIHIFTCYQDMGMDDLRVKCFDICIRVLIIKREAFNSYQARFLIKKCISGKEQNKIPNSFYYIAIILTAILFGLGHLPATIEVFGELSTMIVTRALVLNGLLGLWFGYLYWKKGLEYAMIAHLSAN